MKAIVVPAAKVQQGNLCLYTTSLKVRDLLTEGFYSVETLDPEDPEGKGYQRLLNKARAKKLADYILDGQETKDAFLPTSIFLATDKHIPYDETTHSISIDLSDIGSFSVVDGQHRIEGLRMAASENKSVMQFEVPVNIAIDLPKIAQMCHFLIVNTTQKSVDKSVEQRIYARLTEAMDLEDIPNLPRWIKKTVGKGEDEIAIKIVDYLNDTKDSPWHHKIEMANEENESATISQKSFVKAIKKYLLTASNPLSTYTLDRQQKMLLNYWKAISEILDIQQPTVLYKYNGVELFSRFTLPFFSKLYNSGDFKVPTMKKLLVETFENVQGEYAGVGHPDWWLSGSAASFLNAGAINVVHQEMAKALIRSGSKKDIEL